MNKIYSLTIPMVLLLSACSQNPKQAISHTAEWAMTPCASEIDGAVLRKITEVWSDTPQNTVSDMDRFDYKLRCIREWADSLKDPCIRDSYYKWIESYQRGSKRRRRDIINPEPKDDSLSEYEEENRKIRAYERKHPVPAPPNACDRLLIKKLEKDN